MVTLRRRCRASPSSLPHSLCSSHSKHPFCSSRTTNAEPQRCSIPTQSPWHIQSRVLACCALRGSDIQRCVTGTHYCCTLRGSGTQRCVTGTHYCNVRECSHRASILQLLFTPPCLQFGLCLPVVFAVFPEGGWYLHGPACISNAFVFFIASFLLSNLLSPDVFLLCPEGSR